MESAPFFGDVAKAPPGETCVWLRAEDGVRIRAAHWRLGNRGTVLLFPGRTEYIEKYGPAAGEFHKRGFAMAVVDWRGQGLADRLLEERAPGHVGAFSDYQRDVAAFVSFLRSEDLPEPYYLVGHSMGGCIGLDALYGGLRVDAVTFSAPMWGIRMNPLLRPVAWALTGLAPAFGHGDWIVPGTSPLTYVLEAPFEDNVLTRDAEMYAFMQNQLDTHPELAIGGPTMQWLREALRRTNAHASRPSPDIPCLTMLGASERVVDAASIHDRMRRWPGARFQLVENAEHELMMEGPAIRKRFYDAAAGLFGGGAGLTGSK